MSERRPDQPGDDTPPASWPTVADFAVPAVMAIIQLVGTWLFTSLGGDPLPRWKWMVVTACVLISCVTLIWRRRFPGRVLLVTAVLSCTAVLLAGRDDTLAGGVADGIALFSLAVHRGRRTAVLCALAAWAAAFGAYLPAREGLADTFLNEVLDGFFYIGVVALGQVRRQHKARRAGLAAQLAAAERERAAAAAAERERLARDLHDVAGHHLSAVVVHSGAATRVGDPDLTVQALTAAADTGRDVLKALTRLVDVVGPETDGDGLDTLLPPLCQGLTRLGVPVSLAFEGRARRVRPQVATAAYRIVQESLTNAMRYAPGAAVNVEVCYAGGAVRLTVENAPAPDEAPVPALGSGSGIIGMRERAEAFKGSLTAEPTPSGGWSVQAVLPTAPGGRRGPGWPEVIDIIVMGFTAALPCLLAFAPPDAVLKGWSAGGGALVVLALLARSLPLWWRRHAPFRTLLALVVIDCVWTLAVGPGTPELVALLVIGCSASMFAVYAVGCYGSRGKLTWPAPFVAAVPWGVEFAVLAANDPENAGDVTGFALVFFAVLGAGFGTLVLLPFWAWGKAVARGRRRWEANALETMAARTGAAVLAERHRIALGLRGTVLDHTARLIRSAEAGLAGSEEDAVAALTSVTEQARAALIDMRALLDTMRHDSNS